MSINIEINENTLKITIPKIKTPHEIALELMREIRESYAKEGLEDFVRNLCTPSPKTPKENAIKSNPIIPIPKKTLSWSDNLCLYFN